MSEQFGGIELHYIDAFHEMAYLRAQQLVAAHMGKVLVQRGTAENEYFQQVGRTEWIETNARFPDTPEQDVEHYKRRVVPSWYQWGKMLSRFDTAQMLMNPQGKYLLSASGGYARLIDTKMITAALGNATVEDVNGTTSTVALPTTQKVGIQVGTTASPAEDVNMNEAKVRRAKKIIMENEVDLSDPLNKLYGFMTPAAFFDGLLGQDRVASSDFNGDKPLVTGEMTANWMGIEWIISNRLPFDTGSTTDRKCFIYCMSGLGRIDWQSLTTLTGQRTDKSFTQQLYMEAMHGFTRLEEEKVVEIMIDETAKPTTNS